VIFLLKYHQNPQEAGHRKRRENMLKNRERKKEEEEKEKLQESLQKSYHFRNPFQNH
jgi:hypothetical protein